MALGSINVGPALNSLAYYQQQLTQASIRLPAGTG